MTHDFWFSSQALHPSIHRLRRITALIVARALLVVTRHNKVHSPYQDQSLVHATHLPTEYAGRLVGAIMIGAASKLSTLVVRMARLRHLILSTRSVTRTIMIMRRVLRWATIVTRHSPLGRRSVYNTVERLHLSVVAHRFTGGPTVNTMLSFTSRDLPDRLTNRLRHAITRRPVGNGDRHLTIIPHVNFLRRVTLQTMAPHQGHTLTQFRRLLTVYG